jgi:outer membrane immunogenic protein
MSKRAWVRIVCTVLALTGLAQVTPARAQTGLTLPQGVYIGLDLGGGFGTARKDFANGATSGNFGVSGVVGGATAGMDWQTGGSMLVGLNATFLGSGLSGTTHTSNPDYSYSAANHWLFMLDPRLGFRFWPGVTPYVTGGFTVGDTQISSAPNNAAPGQAVDATRTVPGWNAGAGVEVNLTPNWSLDAQYLHVGLANAGVPGVSGLPAVSSFSTDLFNAGVEFRF